MSNLNIAFKELGDEDVRVINCDEIVAFDSYRVYLDDATAFDIVDFKSSFVRYPYDLIPPHSKSFDLREKTEFHKSLALLFDTISINSLASTWMLRNRAFSLDQVRKLGVEVAEFIIVKKDFTLPCKTSRVVKALGNCFVTDNLESLGPKLNRFVNLEEDDGESAVVFPASLLDTDSIEEYLSIVGVGFLQEEIKAVNEYRGYILGGVSFLYTREETETFDKSAAEYADANYTCTTKLTDALGELMQAFNIDYLCFDFLVDESGSEVVIDINPYGSMPEYSEHPQPSLRLANMMLSNSRAN